MDKLGETRSEGAARRRGDITRARQQEHLDVVARHERRIVGNYRRRSRARYHKNTPAGAQESPGGGYEHEDIHCFPNGPRWGGTFAPYQAGVLYAHTQGASGCHGL